MSSTSIAGDHIGLESCLDIGSAVAAPASDCCYYSERVLQRREERREMRRKEYPPPIPLLSRTEKLASHMPWVLKRYYTSDGRLILREEKVRHHEYLRAHRADGRLTLHLVAMDYNFTLSHPHTEEEEEDEEDCCDDVEKEGESENVAIEGEEETSVVNLGIGGGGKGKCMTYNGVGPSIFGVPISPVRPVHS